MLFLGYSVIINFWEIASLNISVLIVEEVVANGKKEDGSYM